VQHVAEGAPQWEVLDQSFHLNEGCHLVSMWWPPWRATAAPRPWYCASMRAVVDGDSSSGGCLRSARLQMGSAARNGSPRVDR